MCQSTEEFYRHETSENESIDPLYNITPFYRLETCDLLTPVSNLSLTTVLNDYYINAHDIIYESGVPNFQGAKIPLYTSWNVELLTRKLVDYEDREICKFLKYGFPVEILNLICPYQNRTIIQELAVDSFMQTELSYNAISGPFDSNPFSCDLAISPLDTVEKDEVSRRVIVDLSWPEGTSVNTGIDKNVYLGETISLLYPSLDSLTAIIVKKGPGALLFKTDLKRAYRQIFVYPGDMHLLAFKSKDKMYVDRTLPFGLSSAAYICQRVTNMIRFLLKERGIDIVNYIDDLGGADTPNLSGIENNDETMFNIFPQYSWLIYYSRMMKKDMNVLQIQCKMVQTLSDFGPCNLFIHYFRTVAYPARWPVYHMALCTY